MSGLKDIFFITPKSSKQTRKSSKKFIYQKKKLIPVVWILTNNMHLKVATRASVTTDALWLSLSHYLVARISVSQLHTRPTVSISSRSSGECTPRMVGQMEIISRCGYFFRNKPHSSPAWIAFTLGWTANSFS